VRDSFADDPSGGMQTTFSLTDAGNVTVTTGAASPVTITSDAVAVVISHGKNGLGAFQSDGTQLAGAAGDEAENADNDGNFVNRTNAPEFDDILAWISSNIAKSRMVAAGRLP